MTTPVRTPTQWIPSSGQGYVLLPGQNNLVTNSGNYLVANNGNFLVTSGVVVLGKYATQWTQSGV